MLNAINENTEKIKKIETLAKKLEDLRAKRRTLEERLDEVEDQIFSLVGEGGNVSTDRFRVKCMLVVRNIFSKEEFVKRFGEKIYPELTREITARQVFLSKRGG